MSPLHVVFCDASRAARRCFLAVWCSDVREAAPASVTRTHAFRSMKSYGQIRPRLGDRRTSSVPAPARSLLPRFPAFAIFFDPF